jgi:hypothetical protein
MGHKMPNLGQDTLGSWPSSSLLFFYRLQAFSRGFFIIALPMITSLNHAGKFELKGSPRLVGHFQACLHYPFGIAQQVSQTLWPFRKVYNTGPLGIARKVFKNFEHISQSINEAFFSNSFEAVGLHLHLIKVYSLKNIRDSSPNYVFFTLDYF